jgi:cytochrome b561
MSYRGTSDRYGRVAVAIHWTSAVVVGGALVSGFQAVALVDPAPKTALLRVHVLCGVLTLALTLARVGWWFADRRPEPVVGMGRLQARAASGTHLLLYALLFVMAASGIDMMVLSGAGAVLSGAEPAALIPDFFAYAPRIPHGIGARLLMALLVLHIGAAVYHQFIRRDGLMRRMRFSA